MTIPTNEVYRDIVDIVPDPDWKSLLLKILNGRKAGLDVGSSIWGGCAPMMIILDDEGRLYDGLACSWGLRDRQPYVFAGSREHGMVREKARRADQFIYVWTKNCDGCEDVVAEMAEAIGFGDVAQLLKNYWEDGIFRRVPEMCVSTPITLLRDDDRENEYDGQAPCLKNLDEAHVRTWTVGETNSRAFHKGTKESLLPAVLNSGFAPPWFLTEDQQTVFYKLLRAGDHQGAWMSLNSSQWTMEDARRAITELAKEVELPLFREFARAWVALPFPDDWWY